MTPCFQRYTDADREAWDRFVAGARNGIFLFQRRYLEYHRERFEDHSLVGKADGEIVAVLPASQRGETLVSHGGLTFGGLVVGRWMKQARMLDTFFALETYARETGLARMVYKCVPYIYHSHPTQEDLFGLHANGARITDRRAITVTTGGAPFSKDRAYKVRKAERAGVTAGRSDDLAEYWQLLEEVLGAAHESKPVHTVREISSLQLAFPEQIKLYAAWHNEQMVAGVLVYESAMVARAQYIASNETGQTVWALDALFDHLIHEVYAGKPFFDFGTSVDPSTGEMNRGLTAQKEDFGARAVICDTYELEWKHL